MGRDRAAVLRQADQDDQQRGWGITLLTALTTDCIRIISFRDDINMRTEVSVIVSKFADKFIRQGG